MHRVMYVTANADLLWPPMQIGMLSSNSTCIAINKQYSLDDYVHACKQNYVCCYVAT